MEPLSKHLLETHQSYERGDSGNSVRCIQEWLNLYSYKIAIDSYFGEKTKQAVRRFQRTQGLPATGMVGPNTVLNLLRPMIFALSPIKMCSESILGAQVLAYAHHHARQHPREVGGANRGPWVRLYMNGHEGIAWPWCAGFVSYIIKQTCKMARLRLPFQLSLSCDQLAQNAAEKGLLLRRSTIDSYKSIVPGSVFLIRESTSHWIHTGFVRQTFRDGFSTIEGNTNAVGEREGIGVMERKRRYKNIDFILLPN